MAKATQKTENEYVNKIIGSGFVKICRTDPGGRKCYFFFDPYDVMSIESGLQPNQGTVRLARGPQATALTFTDETAEDVANRVQAHKIQFAASESLNDMQKNTLHRFVELISASVLTNIDDTIAEKMETIDLKRVEQTVEKVLARWSSKEKPDKSGNKKG